MAEALLDRAQGLLDDDQPLRRQHFILLGAALATVVLVAVALPDAGVVRAGLAVAAAAALSVVVLASFRQGLIAVLVWLGDICT